MPITSYSLLRGKVINALPYKKGADHFQIEIQAAGDLYRIAVDVYSQLKGSKRNYSDSGETVWDIDREVMYYKDENYQHPLLSSLLKTEEGLTPVDKLPEELHLDYLRYRPELFPIDKMICVPPKDENGDGEDLNDQIDPLVQKAMKAPYAEVFAFGSSWNDADSAHPDPHKYFDPNPSLGIHDIHMNQGDTGSEAKYNGVWQDGALFFCFPGVADDNGVPDSWAALFFRFYNQSTDTDNHGDPTDPNHAESHSSAQSRHHHGHR
jgi:uncharacterized protein YukJ